MACDMKRNRNTERLLLLYFEYNSLRKDITACKLSDEKNDSPNEATSRLTALNLPEQNHNILFKFKCNQLI
jgi:hypothetical protein